MGRILLLLALVAIALAVQAPAWLLARTLEEQSGGTLSLRNATGTVWRGEADAAIRGQPAARRDQALGRVAWRVERLDWDRRALLMTVRQPPAGAPPVTLALGADRIRFAGSVRLPAASAGLHRLLAGWTLGGEVSVDSDGVEWAAGAGAGTMTALWRNATLAPPDLPGGFALGEVTARIALGGAAPAASLRNSGGDIELSGEGSAQSGKIALLLQPRAGATPAQTVWLQSHTMGRTPRGYSIETGWPGR
ncbi:MAG: type II secretion system protein N [Betaproteobacteria bacterium]|nr:type II secretion system protein N [Betaproteobacteria bacterium]